MRILHELGHLRPGVRPAQGLLPHEADEVSVVHHRQHRLLVDPEDVVRLPERAHEHGLAHELERPRLRRADDHRPGRCAGPEPGALTEEGALEPVAARSTEDEEGGFGQLFDERGGVGGLDRPVLDVGHLAVEVLDERHGAVPALVVLVGAGHQGVDPERGADSRGHPGGERGVWPASDGGDDRLHPAGLEVDGHGHVDEVERGQPPGDEEGRPVLHDGLGHIALHPDRIVFGQQRGELPAARPSGPEHGRRGARPVEAVHGRDRSRTRPLGWLPLRPCESEYPIRSPRANGGSP